MASSASGPEKKFAGHAVESSAGLRRGRHSRHQHELAVWFAPRLGGKSHLGIHFQYIGQGGDFFARRVVERARRQKIRGIARRAPSAAAGWPKGVFCRGRTETVSNNPARATERSTNCCRPTPSDSNATSEATPTAMPSVVSEFRRTASRKFRAASSVRSLAFHRRRSSWEIAPSESVTMRSAYRSASARSCVTMMMVLPGPDAGR